MPLIFQPTIAQEKAYRRIDVPCNNCVGCRLEYSKMWAVRCYHESKSHKQNSFLTLTFNDEHLPSDRSVNIQHLQKFLKRLRINIQRAHRLKTAPILRYFACGEYGEKFSRPHYHVNLFGYDFSPDRKLHTISKGGHNQYTSDLLDKSWQHQGFATIGDLTWQTAAYTARYIMKKQNGPKALTHYLNPETGEIYAPEFVTMSKKPGLGAWHYQKNHQDYYPSGRCVVKTGETYREVKTPRYYDKLQARAEANIDFPQIPGSIDEAVDSRIQFAQDHEADNTPERLAVREEVQERKLHRLYRGYEQDD